MTIWDLLGLAQAEQETSRTPSRDELRIKRDELVTSMQQQDFGDYARRIRASRQRVSASRPPPPAPRKRRASKAPAE